MSKIYIDKEGYKRFKASGKRVDRQVIEKRLGIKLSKYMMVHHKNGIKTDDRFDNLQLMTKKEFAKSNIARKNHLKTSKTVEVTKIIIWILRLVIERIVGVFASFLTNIKRLGRK